MKRLRLGIDLDGVVADFTGRFLGIANATYNLELRPQDQTAWAYTCQGLTNKQEGHIWNIIKDISNFWTTLEPLPNTEHLNRASHEHELFFITSRVPTRGMTVQLQSAAWLDKRFYVSFSTVIVVTDWPEKSALYDALKLDAFIDDKPETVEEMHRRHQRVFIQDQPYNREVEAPRVSSLNEFLEVVSAE